MPAARRCPQRGAEVGLQSQPAPHSPPHPHRFNHGRRCCCRCAPCAARHRVHAVLHQWCVTLPNRTDLHCSCRTEGQRTGSVSKRRARQRRHARRRHHRAKRRRITHCHLRHLPHSRVAGEFVDSASKKTCVGPWTWGERGGREERSRLGFTTFQPLRRPQTPRPTIVYTSLAAALGWEPCAHGEER